MPELSGRMKVSVLGGIALWFFARTVLAADILPAPGPRLTLPQESRFQSLSAQDR